MASDLRYTYDSLPGRTIRLLRLRPGPPGSPLIGSLDRVSLDDANVEYKALSYAWGDESPQSILWVDGVDGKLLLIRPNLAAALRQLRQNQLSCCDLSCVCQKNPTWAQQTVHEQFTFPTYLWMDAVCIDQSNEKERSQQVSLMHEIYTKASTVIAWLGEEDEYTVPALRLLYGLSNLLDWWSDDAKSAMRHLSHNRKFKSFWVALGHFFSRSWWTRMWIVQEIVLARDVILVCGHWCASWTRLNKATLVLMDSSTDELSEATAVTGEYRHFYAALRGIGLLECLKIFKASIRSGYNLNGTPSRERPLSALLFVGRRYEATDPLDKVYGILGLLRGFGINPQLEVRYCDMTVCDLYMLAAELIYKEEGNLDFLGLVEVNRSIDQIRRFSLPSWAPDFTLPVNHLSMFCHMRYARRWLDKVELSREVSWTFAFTGDSQSCCKFDLKTKTIIVTGFRVDTIQRIEPRITDIMKSFKVDPAVRYGKRICWLPPDEVEESYLERVWDSFLGHECSQARAWVDTEKIGVENMFPPPLLNLQCFQAAKMGLCGVTDAAIRLNDHICGLPGLSVPCILRRQEDSWRFVGLSCIIDLEVMHGCLMEGVKTGVFALEEFVIR
ncbi:heterokaryon incompatibility protein-domain-containing protein [Durotheca rogersii]|uniref:heterokaryon incompatibility protein-domain-containing protein n=1 Tax=Durotheca rogersii TaxID=419775 RepID=UPI00221EAFC5|nr:heterokaryon incompatibility protein-domain-containing protein [Durotheca rogersii]KAI5865815.1 heterokaryon incompatibility protein-domain-containing protein [Durotheca rogersii]